MITFFRVGFLVLFSSVAAYADRMISFDTVNKIAEQLRSEQCANGCQIDSLNVDRVTVPADILVGDRKTFLVKAIGSCGSAGCPTALLAIGRTDIHYLGDGLGIEQDSPGISSAHHGTLVPTSAASDFNSEVRGSLRTFEQRYPDTHEAVRRTFSGNQIMLASINEAFTKLIEISYAGSLSAVLNPLGITPDAFVDEFFTHPDIVVFGLNKGLSTSVQNVAGSAVKDAAIEVTSALVAEYIVSRVVPDAGDTTRTIAFAAFSAAVSEALHIGTSPNLSKAALDGLVRRAWDIVDIIIATNGVLKTQDRVMISTIGAIEGNAELVAGETDPAKLERANQWYKEIKSEAVSTYGKDDAAAVEKILDLTRSALIRFKLGELDTAIILKEHILLTGKSSANIHAFSLITKPTDWVSAAFRLGQDAPERAAQIAITGTSLALIGKEAAVTTTGVQATEQLCLRTRNPLDDTELRQTLDGGELRGISRAGRSWAEYLSGGRTIFINAAGKQTIGGYSISDGRVCFSYGTTNAWSCKTLARCTSGEAAYVITDLEGKQTSLVQSIIPKQGNIYHYRHWSRLASQQSLAVPPNQSRERSYTSIPADLAATAESLSRKLGNGKLRAEVNRDLCELSITQSKVIEIQYRQGGGMIDFLGNRSNTHAKVGTETATYRVFLEGVENATRDSGNPAKIWIVARPGQPFVYELDVRRTDDTSLNKSTRQQALNVGVLLRSAGAVNEATSAILELSKACRGEFVRKEETSSVAAPVGNPGSVITGLKNCSKESDVLRRLSCFDDLAKTYTQEPSVAASGLAVSLSALHNEISAELLSHKELQGLRRTFGYLPGAYEAAIAQGLVAPMVQHAQKGVTNHGNSWQSAVTSIGRERGIAAATPYNMTSAQAAVIEVDIVDLSDVSSGQDRATAEFNWRYVDPPGVFQRFTQRGGSGVAELRRMESGWRVQNLKVKSSGIPFPRTAQIESEIALDIQRTRSTGGPWLFAEREKIFVPAAAFR